MMCGHRERMWKYSLSVQLWIFVDTTPFHSNCSHTNHKLWQEMLFFSTRKDDGEVHTASMSFHSLRSGSHLKAHPHHWKQKYFTFSLLYIKTGPLQPLNQQVKVLKSQFKWHLIHLDFSIVALGLICMMHVHASTKKQRPTQLRASHVTWLE
jgi:hypothetical protein